MSKVIVSGQLNTFTFKHFSWLCPRLKPYFVCTMHISTLPDMWDYKGCSKRPAQATTTVTTYPLLATFTQCYLKPVLKCSSSPPWLRNFRNGKSYGGNTRIRLVEKNQKLDTYHRVLEGYLVCCFTDHKRHFSVHSILWFMHFVLKISMSPKHFHHVRAYHRLTHGLPHLYCDVYVPHLVRQTADG